MEEKEEERVGGWGKVCYSQGHGVVEELSRKFTEDSYEHGHFHHHPGKGFESIRFW